MFCVVDIDIVDSRKISNRMVFQKKLIEKIDKVNESMREWLLCPITMTLGDEWQAVLKSPENMYEYIEVFQRFCLDNDVEIYAGCGIGEMNTAVEKDSRFMDGECFVLAREALETAKNTNTYYNKGINSRDNRIYIKGRDCEDSLLIMINALIDNNETLKKRVTQKQMEIIEIYEEVGSYKRVMEVNKSLSKASISQKLNDSNYFLIKNNREVIKRGLREWSLNS